MLAEKKLEKNNFHGTNNAFHTKYSVLKDRNRFNICIISINKAKKLKLNAFRGNML